MSLLINPAVDRVIQHIHAAADEEIGWRDVLLATQELLRSRLVTLAKYDFARGQGVKLYSTCNNSAFRETYAREFAARNPWCLSSLDYQPGRILPGTELLSEEALQRTDFYRRFLKQYDLLQRLCGVLARRGEVAFYLAAYRSANDPAFAPGDETLLGCLQPHLTRALQRHWLICSERSLSQALSAVLDQLGSAVLLVDQEARLVFHNSVAEQLLARREGLYLRDTRLQALPAAVDRALLEAVAEMAACQDSSAHRIVTLTKNLTTRPLVAIVRPLPRVFRQELADYCQAAMLIIKHPQQLHDVQRCTFAQSYQLTGAQARLTTLLLAGYSLAGAAQQLHVSENTVRSHLKQVFLKTSTHSQMELVHLHARVCSD